MKFVLSCKVWQHWFMSVFASLGVLLGCQSSTMHPTPEATKQQNETLVYYAWPGYMPQAVLDAFATEYGIKVDYQQYDSQKDAIAKIKAGKVCDVVVIDNDLIPSLVADGLLAEIDYRYVPNFKNISANFRDLAYDPNNQHAIPFNWGTTGLLYRRDLLPRPVTRWGDLWDRRYAGKVAIWALQRPLLPIALKHLGYSVNSEKPSELNQALQSLLELKNNVTFVDLNQASVTPNLESGQALIAYGWAYDALANQSTKQNIAYVLPQEGTILWGDNLVIMAHSQHKKVAELFLNFLLRPQIGAQIVNELYYANANEAARQFVKPELANNPLVYPPNSDLRNAEIMLPPSPAGKQLYDEIWDHFMTAVQAKPK
ncbi:MAG: spermidine/putrescine ABC transporter substrate-binding protein [Caldilineaceae bacterium]